MIFDPPPSPPPKALSPNGQHVKRFPSQSDSFLRNDQVVNVLRLILNEIFNEIETVLWHLQKINNYMISF